MGGTHGRYRRTTGGAAPRAGGCRRSPSDQFIDWRPAPRRQYVVTLSGEAKVEASDGEIRRLGPGTIMLAEDTTGKVHITRGVGTVERLSLFIPIPD
jgi:hypothetical protein